MVLTQNIFVVPSLATLPIAYRPASPAIAARRAEILETIKPDTHPAPSALPFLKPRPSVRQLRVPPEKLVLLLSQSFSESDLLTTGVARRRDGQLCLSRAFGTQTTSFQFRYDGKLITDVISARGVVSGARRELARLASETCDSSVVAAAQAVVVTDCDEDARLFQQLGLHVTSAVPLRNLTSDKLAHYLQVCPPFGLLSKWNIRIPLWRPYVLERSAPPSALQIVQRLDRLDRFSNLNSAALFRIWYPSPDEVSQFRQISALGDGTLLAAEFHNSLARSSYAPGDALTLLRDDTPLDFGTALRRLEQVIDQSIEFEFPQFGEASAALQVLKRAYRRDVLSRFPTASEAADGREATVTCMAAQLAEEWFKRLDEVVAALAIRDGHNPQRIDSESLFEMRLKVIDAFCKLYRHLPKLR